MIVYHGSTADQVAFISQEAIDGLLQWESFEEV